MADVLSGASEVQGEAANDAPVVGNPVLIGARASNAIPTAVSADGDVVYVWADRNGRLVEIGSDYLMVQGVPLQVKQSGINATASGDTTVVALVSSKKLRVVSLIFTCSAAVAVAWKSGGGSTLISAMSFAANGGLDLNRTPHGYFTETVSGEALVINLSTTANVRGSLNYVEV